jgi:hypothetical protein
MILKYSSNGKLEPKLDWPHKTNFSFERNLFQQQQNTAVYLTANYNFVTSLCVCLYLLWYKYQVTSCRSAVCVLMQANIVNKMQVEVARISRL